MTRLPFLSAFVLLAVLGGPAYPESVSASPVVLEDAARFLVIPSTLARVTDAYFPSGTVGLPEFVLIQDVHKHPEVQGHIASLILQGYRQWGVKKVFLEGAFTNVDLTMFHRLPDKTRNMLLTRLVRDGDLSGAELASVLLTETEWSNPSTSPFQLFGMEEPKLYRQNMAAYQDVLLFREEALRELASIRRLQNDMRIPQRNLLAEQLDRTETLLHLKMTPAEYNAYSLAREAIPSSPHLDPAIRAAERFYTLVQRRSFVFLKRVEKKAPASPGPRILVVGGFHTSIMAAYLKDKGRTFVVLAPQVTEAGYEPLYEAHMMGSLSALQRPPTVSAAPVDTLPEKNPGTQRPKEPKEADVLAERILESFNQK